MRIVFAGTPDPAVVALQHLIDSGHDVVGVITRPDARKGRGRTMHPSPVAALAEKHAIPMVKPTSLKPGPEDGDDVRERLRQWQPECIPVVAYGNLITSDLLDVAPHGWVNLHFSLLPAWRGAAPVQAAILHGDEITGASTFRIEQGLDTGTVLGSITEPIHPTDTSDDLLTRLAYKGAELLVATLDGLEAGTVVARPQDGTATYAPKIDKHDARIDWQQPAHMIDRQIRAHTPAPGAWTMMGEDRVKVGPVTQASPEGSTPDHPGHVVVTKRGVFVGTGTDPVQLGQMQVPGKKMMSASDWARGAQVHGDEGVVWQ